MSMWAFPGSASTPPAYYPVSLLAATSGGALAEADALAGINSINLTEVPYLTYTSGIPSTYTQLSNKPVFYNSSYNLYSVHNYVNPANSLEPFSLSTTSAFFGTYNGVLSEFPSNLVAIGNGISASLISPQNNTLTMLSSSDLQALSLQGTPTMLGRYPYWSIHNPLFIAAAPNGYIYVINSTTNNCPGGWWTLCIGSTTTSYLFVMRYIPQGYANLTNDQPTTMQTTSDLASWIKEWKNYYSGTILEGSQNLYITNIYKMTSTFSNWITGTSSGGGLIAQLIPLAIATDNNGDVFALGAHINKNVVTKVSTTSFQLAGILNTGAKISTTMTQPQVKGKFQFIPSDEFAASPGGQYVYAANASYWNGEIEVYSTGTGTSGNAVSSGAPLNAPVPSVSSNNIISGTNVILTANPTGGTPPYISYQWYSGSDPTCQNDNPVTGEPATPTTYSEAPTASTYYCYQVTDSNSPPANAYSGTVQVVVNGAGASATQAPAPQLPTTDSTALTPALQQQVAGSSSCGYITPITGTSLTAQQFFDQVLEDLSVNGQPIPCSAYPADEKFLETWAQFESPCFDSGSGCPNFNPLSTTWKVPGCGSSINGAGVQSYTNYQTGAYAEAATLALSYYKDIQTGLYQGANPSWYAQNALSDFKTWGTTNGLPGQLSSGNAITSISTKTGTITAPGSCVGGTANGSGGSNTPGATTPQTLSTFVYSGNIPLSYSNSTSNMNITAYLANGGPYGDPAVAAAYKGLPPTNDIAAFHHPVSIVDSRGILYVIDNWTIYANSMQSTILMLRAFAENGTEITINPSSVNTTLSATPPLPGLTASKGQGINPSVYWRPFGWPLSANITTSQGNTISYCAAQCTNDPTSMRASSNVPAFNSMSYAPIGPWISATSTMVGPYNSIAISADFNGTLYIIAHPWSYTQATQTNWYGIVEWLSDVTSQNWGSAAADVALTELPTFVPNKQLYTELLVMHPTIQNYTKMSLAENNSYLCYLSISPPSSSPCISDSNTQQYLPNLYAPILGVPSAFSYVESLGNPEQYLNLPNAFSATFPTGVNNNKYSSQASSLANNGISNPDYGSLATTTPSGGAAGLVNIPNTYLKSSVKGYVITPYNITLRLDQVYSNVICTPESPPGVVACAAVRATGLLSSAGLFDVQKKYYGYITTQLNQNPGPLSNTPSLNTTIEGGSTYLQYLPGQATYIPNVSDAGLIISPYINFQVFTNRLFGEIYINQTINPSTVQGSGSSGAASTGSGKLPVVINATNNYNYSEIAYVQDNYPAFSVQTAMPLSNSIVGVNCGSSCPPGYYYNPSKAYSGSSNLIYNHTVPATPSALQLAELFKISRYVDNLVLDLTSKPSSGLPSAPLGYNRLVYTYVDRFNNIIYMPLDVDFANITQVSLTTSEVISPTNTNQTTVTVNGLAVYSTPGGTMPVPKGTPVYLYYDANINYLNSTSCPNGSSCTNSNPLGYYKNAIICAFAPATKSCVLANPLSTLTQPQPVGAQEANIIAFHTDTNATGGCAPQPNSLLTLPKYNCNIYGSDGTTNNIPSVQWDQNANSSQGGYQYCIPVFNNGTGMFTTQLGLIKIVNTDQNGNFSDKFTACGTGIDTVTAAYYGANAPEPIIAMQSPLSLSGGASEFSQANAIKSSEFNYTYSPNSTSTSFSIGSYALGIGTIGIIGLAIALSASMIIIFMMGIRKKKR